MNDRPNCQFCRPIKPARGLGFLLLLGMTATPVFAEPKITPDPDRTSDAIAQTDAVLSLGRASDIISDWLSAKNRIFAPPFDREILAVLTTGRLYADTLKAIDYLMENDAYYEYGVQKVESVDRFSASGSRATIEVRITEDVTFYENGKMVESTFNTQPVRYKLEYDNRSDRWRISDSQILE